MRYAERHALEALLATRDGETIFEHYAPDFGPDVPHALYSGTKSFWGVAAVAARDDGLLSLDETVGATFPAWAVGSRAGVTLRMLLQLTSGIGFGGLGNAVPTYEKALAVEPKAAAGTAFTYGGIPLQVFGAVLAEKLRASGRSPHAYLRERILTPIGCAVASWRTLADGTQPLPTGAFLTAAAWSAYGRFMAAGGTTGGVPLIAPDGVAACVAGSATNPRYGLGWWLSPIAAESDAFYASGAGGQGLYVFPRTRTTIVKFSRGGSSFAHATFLRRLRGDGGSPTRDGRSREARPR